MRCKQCGAAYDPQDHYCRNCGARLGEPPVQATIPAAPDPAAAARRGKTKKRLMTLAACLVIGALAIVIVSRMLPDLISLSFGGKPKDLGVKYTDADYQSILAKTAVEADEPPEGSDRRKYADRFDGTQDIDWTLTESELTAWFNMDRQPGYWPFEQVQMKLHEDGVIEASLCINPVKLMTFDCVTETLPQEIQSFLGGITQSIPMYAKARVAFTGPKQVHIEMLACQAASLPVSELATGEQANQILEAILNGVFASADPIAIDEFTTGEGSLHMKGAWYRAISRVPAK